MDSGYIKIWRKILTSRVFQNDGLLKVWLWCLLKASRKERWVSIKSGKGQVEVHLMPGQFIFGRDSASKDLKMHPSSVWKRMQKLKNIENCDIESNSQYSIVSIINWEIYQADEKNSNSESNSQVTAKEQPSNTNKNVENVKNNIYPEIANRILEKINQLSGKKFKNTEPILAVLKSKTVKATEENCLKVVEHQFKNDYIREKYFTPDSLFRITKFKAKLDNANNDFIPGDDTDNQPPIEDQIS